MISRSNLHTNYTNLSVISRKVVDSFLALRDQDRQYLLILHWLGYRRAELEVKQSDRLAGRSSYSVRQLVKVAVDGVFFQSTVCCAGSSTSASSSRSSAVASACTRSAPG